MLLSYLDDLNSSSAFLTSLLSSSLMPSLASWTRLSSAIVTAPRSAPREGWEASTGAAFPPSDTVAEFVAIIFANYRVRVRNGIKYTRAYTRDIDIRRARVSLRTR